MRALKALLLADDRPGHYHLSEGIVAAAQRLAPVKVMRVGLKRRWPGRVLAALSNARAPARWILRAAYGIDPRTLPPADFIVSAGAEALAASVAASRLLGAPNIHYGSLRTFRPQSFALVLTSYAGAAQRERHAMVLKPSALALERRPDRDRQPGDPPRRAALLLGGDSGECRFAEDEWESLLTFLGQAHVHLGTQWHVSNSRRTPAAASDRIAARAAAGDAAIAMFLDVRTAGPGTLAQVLAGVDAVLCTDDSSSMISECVAVGLPVLGVRPRQQDLTADEQGYRQYMTGEGWYRSMALADLTPDAMMGELAAIRPLREDPLDWVASLLKERIPHLFAG